MRRVALIGAASGHGGEDPRCAEGPAALARAGALSWVREPGLDADWREIRPGIAEATPVLRIVADMCAHLADAARAAVEGNAIPLVLGGDHSCAVGTWSGIAAARRPVGPVGLVWIDAHMDSHVPETSPSGNLHGMPLAHLLGHGAPELTGLAAPGPAIAPQHVSLIGARSFEPEEPALLERLGVRVYDMGDIRRSGFTAVFREAVHRASAGTAGYGVSLDLDALDPADAPGTASTVPGGIRAAELSDAFAGIGRDETCLGIEIAEYNPALDRGGATIEVVRSLIAAMFAGKR